MGDDAIGATRRRPSYLKWTCGCLFCLIVLIGLTGLVVWYALGRWTPGESAWERMPAETQWAVEAHDIKFLLEYGLKDEGMASLLRRLGGLLPEDFLEAETRGRRRTSDPVEELREVQRAFGSFYTFLVPNIGLMGGTGADEDDIFIIFKPPTLFRWLISPADNTGQITNVDDDPGSGLCLASQDGWLIVSPSRDTVQKVLDDWHLSAKPLGPASGRSDAFLSFGYRTPGAGDETANGSTLPAAPGHFMLNDPFAGAEGGLPQTADKRNTLSPNVRFLLLPQVEGWIFYGEVSGGDEMAASPNVLQSVESALGAGAPTHFSGELSDFEIAVRMAPGVRDASLRSLDSLSLPSEVTDNPRLALGWRWLREAWLANTQGDITLSGEGPPQYGVGEKVESGLDVPPIPLFVLGWTIKDGVVPRLAGEEFTNSLKVWLDAVKSPGGTLLMQSIRDSLDYRVEEQGLEGVVLLPLVHVSGARPAWRFNLESKPPMGWMSTYPSGIPQAIQRGKPLFLRLGTPPQDQFAAAASWDLGQDFLDSFAEWILDRWNSVPAESKDFDLEQAKTGLDVMKACLTAFPRGSMVAHGDTVTRRIVFKGVVPPGEKVKLK